MHAAPSAFVPLSARPVARLAAPPHPAAQGAAAAPSEPRSAGSAAVVAVAAGAAAAAASQRRAPRRSCRRAVATATEAGVDREAWQRGYESAYQEQCYTVECADLPEDLVGTYFRNGPAKFNVGADKITHPFDGDGMVAALSFDGTGKLHFRNRFVRTPGFVEELKAEKMLYRGTFSLKPGGMMNNIGELGGDKNVANTSVMYWGDELLALWEGSKPTSLDPLSLATKGVSTMGGCLKDADRFCAHPRYDPATGRMVGFQNVPGPTSTKLTFWEFEPGSFKEHSRIEAEAPGFGFYHDFLVTENYYVMSKGPLDMDLPEVLKGFLGMQCIGDSMKFNKSKPGQLILVPRDGSKAQVIDVDPHFTFHFANGFEEDGRVVVDMARASELVLNDDNARPDIPVWFTAKFEDLPKSALWRYSVKPGTQDWSRQEICGSYLDFAAVPDEKKGMPYRFTYCLTSTCAAGPIQALLKIDVTDPATRKIWIPEPYEFLGEPLFVAKKGAKAGDAEDDGYVISILLNGRTKKTEFVVFGADDVEKGPICRVPLGTHIPHALHGTWASGFAPSQAEIEEAWSKVPTSLG